MIMNVIVAVLTDQVMQRLVAFLEQISADLPLLTNLTAEERQSVQSIADGRLPYVRKCLRYCKAHRVKVGMTPENLAELVAIEKLFTQLSKLLRLMGNLRYGLGDTQMQVGANLFRLSRAAHLQMEIAYANGKPGIEAMLDDMDKLFEGQGNFKSGAADKSADAPTTPPADGQA